MIWLFSENIRIFGGSENVVVLHELGSLLDGLLGALRVSPLRFEMCVLLLLELIPSVASGKFICTQSIVRTRKLLATVTLMGTRLPVEYVQLFRP